MYLFIVQKPSKSSKHIYKLVFCYKNYIEPIFSTGEKIQTGIGEFNLIKISNLLLP